MFTKIIATDGKHKLISRYNSFYKTDDYYLRTTIIHDDEEKIIEFGLNENEKYLLLKERDFEKIIRLFSKHHDFSYDTLLKDFICSYIIEEYGLLTPGIDKIARDLLRYPSVAEEFYENVIVNGVVPMNGIKLKGYTAYDLQREKGISNIQAYLALVEIVGNRNIETKSETKKSTPNRRIHSSETIEISNMW